VRENGVGEVSIAGVCADEIGIAEVGIDELGTGKSGIKEIGTAKVSTAEVGTAEVGMPEVGAVEAERTEVEISEVGHREFWPKFTVISPKAPCGCPLSEKREMLLIGHRHPHDTDGPR
jgi:hypothetical protein